MIRREIRTEIASALRELAQGAKGAAPLTEIERELSSIFQAEVRFDNIQRNTQLRNAIRKPFSVRLTVHVEPHEGGDEAETFRDDDKAPELRGQAIESPARPVGSIDRTPVGPTRPNAVPGEDSPPSRSLHLTVERLIRELDSLSRLRDFIWAGYVVKEMLPGLGLSTAEAQDCFDRLVRDGILLLSKIPNPRNPDFPSTRVQLNREHPQVRQVVKKEKAAERFAPLGRIPGEPLSETIIRERR